MTAEPEGTRFLLTRLRPGYRIDDVDALIDRIEATLAGTAVPGQALTGADVRAAMFRTTRRRGYDEQQVDRALDQYAAQLDARRGT